MTGDGKFNLGTDTQSRYRKDCASVVNKPLTDRPAHKKPLNCMHSPANTMKHYFQYVRTSLADIDCDSPSHLLVKELLREAETQLNDTGAWNQTKSLDESYSRRIKIAETKAEQYQNAGDDMMHDHWMNEVAELTAERLENADGGFGNAQKLRAGMEKFVESAKFYLDKKSKKPRGPASYAINKSFEIDRISTFKEGRARPGGYQTKRTANDVSTASGVIGSSDNMYFSVGKDAILPEHWKEAFELCEYGRAPAAWREIFVSDNDLDGSQKIKAEYTSHK